MHYYYKTCKTTELTEEQLNAVCMLFSEVFGHERNPDYIHTHFSSSVLGYSWLSMVEDEQQQLVASNLFIPYLFRMRDSEVLMALSADTMVRPGRKLGAFVPLNMFEDALPLMKTAGVAGVYGFPNDNFFRYNIDIMGRTHLGFLEFYLLPLKCSWKSRMLKWLDLPLRMAAKGTMRVLQCFASSKELYFPIEKKNDSVFQNQRYDQRHHKVELNDGGHAVYTVYREGGMMIAYILDIFPLSAYSFYGAMLKISECAGTQVDMVAYPSVLLNFFTPFRLPHRLMPRKLHMVADMFEKTTDGCWRDLKNWNINLSTFDVR